MLFSQNLGMLYSRFQTFFREFPGGLTVGAKSLEIGFVPNGMCSDRNPDFDGTGDVFIESSGCQGLYADVAV